MHRDGSFSAFGESDLSGSTWLTAFVLKCFGQARSIVKVDDQVLSRSMVWLLGQQDQDGSFREPGTSMRWVDQSGTQTGVSHTAFILTAMLENRGFKLVADSRLNNAITKAMHYLEAQINDPHDMYTVAVLCYAIAKSGSSISPSCFNKLQTGAFNQGDKTYWQHSRMVNKRANSRMAPSRAPSRDIEATSYALLTYSELGKLNEGRKVVNWLVSQRNPSGGFASTQDTVVSLQALSEFAARFPMNPSSFPNYGLHLNTTGNNFVHEYQITPATYDTTYSFEVPSNVPSIHIYTTGEGVAVIDVTTSYYIQSDLQDPRISISASIIKESLNSITVHNCMRWTGPTPSGMLLMEVERPTGFMTDVDKLNVQTTIKRQERNGRFHVLYFDSLAVNSQVCVDVKMDRSDPVVKSQACHVMVYDYYEPYQSSVTEQPVYEEPSCRDIPTAGLSRFDRWLRKEDGGVPSRCSGIESITMPMDRWMDGNGSVRVLTGTGVLKDVKEIEFNQIRNLKCTAVPPMRTYNQISLARCGMRCSANTECMIISYDHNLRTCYLLDTSPFDQSLWSTFVHDVGWSTYFAESPPGNQLIGINATLSSVNTEGWSVALRAIDGDLSTDHLRQPPCAHTALSTDNFWQMEFEMPAPVTAVDIYFRSDDCNERNINIWLYVCQTDTECAENTGTLCAFFGGPPVNPALPQRVTCDKAGYGRFLRLRQLTSPPGTNLQLCEIIAYS
ncbi:CD109 antigen-like [Mya arenaria]|uniref:CD109 antigen-like n=1 Tax=Mya arenaria TaxID=6604 RepID=UPI0022E5ACD2|nr:CD109 antigen-like [Mya arenaria]